MEKQHSSETALVDSKATVSARQLGQRGTSLALQPATRQEFAVELTACLALVVPVGMTEEARREWLSVAWQTLKHLPSDLLAAGCLQARKTADHPSKIVPAIVAYAEPRLSSRKRIEREHGDPTRPALTAPGYVTPEEATQILKEFGLKSNPVAPEGEGED